MAEEATGTDSSDNSFSEDESSYRLPFNLPDNDQTWLYCPPGEDPNSVVDLTEWLSIRPSFVSKHSHIVETAAGDGHVFDTRTFTRSKKTSGLTIGKAVTQRNIDYNSDTLKHKTEIPSSTKIPFITSPGKEPDYDKLQHNKENLMIPLIKKNSQKINLTSYSGNDTYNEIKKSKARDDIILLENVSQPQSFFSDYSLNDPSTNSENLSPQDKNTEKAFADSFNIECNVSHNMPLEGERLKDSAVFKTPLLPTPNLKEAGLAFKPSLVSTPKSSKLQARIKFDKDVKPKKTDYEKLEGNVNLNETFITVSTSDERSLLPKQPIILKNSENLDSCDEASKNILESNDLITNFDMTYSVCEDIAIRTDKNTKKMEGLCPEISFSLIDYDVESAVTLIKPSKVDVKKEQSIGKSEYICFKSKAGQEPESRLRKPKIRLRDEDLKIKTIRKSISHESLLVHPKPTPVKKTEKSKIHESAANLTTFSTLASGLRQPSIRLRGDEAAEGYTAKCYVSSDKPTATCLSLHKGGSLLPKPFCIKKSKIESLSNKNIENVVEEQNPVIQKDKGPIIAKPPTVVSRIPRGRTRIPKPKQN